MEVELGRPEIINDRKVYQQYTKEHSDLTPIVTTFRKHQSIQEEIEGNQSLLQDPDHEMRKLAREEIDSLSAELANLEKRLKLLLLPKDPNDEKNTVLEIRAGTGGDEAGLFAADLFRMYSRYAEIRGWKTEVLSQSET